MANLPPDFYPTIHMNLAPGLLKDTTNVIHQKPNSVVPFKLSTSQ